MVAVEVAGLSGGLTGVPVLLAAPLWNIGMSAFRVMPPPRCFSFTSIVMEMLQTFFVRQDAGPALPRISAFDKEKTAKAPVPKGAGAFAV